MAKSAKDAETKPLSFAERQLKVLLERLRNHLRHTSGTSQGRVSRKRKDATATLEIEVSVKGRVSVLLKVKENNGTGNYNHCVATLDAKGVAFIGGRKWMGHGRHAMSTPLADAYAAKVVRHALNRFFPGFYQEREEWTPPLRPVNERFLPIY